MSSQVKDQTPSSLDESSTSREDHPTDNPGDNTDRSPPENKNFEDKELRIEIIRQEGRRVRALRMKVSHFLNSMNYRGMRSPNQFKPENKNFLILPCGYKADSPKFRIFIWSNLVWYEPCGS